MKIGITGGIGSGKSTVCRVFEVLGIPVYYADKEAKRLMVEDKQLIQGIKELFGSEAYLKDGRLNRAHIAKKAFSDPITLKKLNALVHPAVQEDSIRWHEKQTSSPYTLKEAALLFESGSYLQLDKIICVYAPEKVRLERVMARDGSSEEAVRERMRKQWPEVEKLRRADFLVLNDGRHGLIEQVVGVDKRLRAKFLS